MTASGGTTVRAVEVVEPGPLATTQDLGRVGVAHLGVPRSGAADRAALRLANRLLGNREDAVAIEVTLGGLVARAHGALSVAVTGAPAPMRLAGRPVATNCVLRLHDGDELGLGPPPVGLRSYLAVGGGLRPGLVLGSGSTDLLSGLGPPPLAAGDVLAAGPAPLVEPVVDVAPVPPPTAGDLVLPLHLGPRADWFTPASVERLFTTAWQVTPASNRIGLRLAGEPLAAARDTALPSEGMALGAVQVPPGGQPILFLADHPVTGGYPVVGVVDDAAMDAAGQAVPGQVVRFRPVH